jgi:ADP-ribose pyrophosphatase YjhB (NUDIX family)
MILNKVDTVSIAAFNCDGELLFGFRNDSSKWTLSGGHIEPGESPLQAAQRELREETGLTAINMELLGSEEVKPGFTVYAFQALVQGTPTSANDPDQEVQVWQFMDVHNGLPQGLINNLQHPKNVTLRLLGLLDPYVPNDTPDEIDSALTHIDPFERTMALKLGNVQPRHLISALNTPHPELHAQALAHPGVTAEVLAHIMRGDLRSIQEAALEHKSTSQLHVARLANNLRDHLDKNPNDQESLRLLVKLFNEYNLDMVMVNEFALDPHLPLTLRCLLYSHPDLMPDLLVQALSTKTYDPELRLAALKNPKAPTQQVLDILKDPNEPNSIVMAAATCPRLTAEDLDSVVFHAPFRGYHPKLQQFALMNPHIQARHIDHIQAGMPVERNDDFQKSLTKFLYKNCEEDALEDMLGINSKLNALMDACKFLTGNKPLALDLRTALFQHDGDLRAAVLVAHGMEPTEQNKLALSAIIELKELKKSDIPDFFAQEVKALVPEAEAVAKKLQAAFAIKNYEPVTLKGKHIAGAVIVHCEDKDILLKPGTKKNSPALGLDEDQSSQSQREAAFYHVAEAFGIGNFFPRADLVSIVGKEYAAIELLPGDFVNLDTIRKESPDKIQQVLYPYVNSGTVWLWALIDLVLANSDRHANNAMVDSQNRIALIDHGSAFAGMSFAPGTDENSFVPYYLRFGCPAGFNMLSIEDKLKIIPRASKQIAEELKAWANSLDISDLQEILVRYDIDPLPSSARLATVQALSQSMPIDEVLANIWTGAIVPSFE